MRSSPWKSTTRAGRSWGVACLTFTSSPAFEPRLPLLDEGAHPLFLIVGREQLAEGVALEPQPRRRVARQGDLKSALGGRERAPRTRSVPPGVGHGGRVNVLGGNDPIEQADLARLSGLQVPPRVDH